MNLGKLTQGRFSVWPENLVNHVGILTHGRFSCFQVVPVPPFGYYGGGGGTGFYGEDWKAKRDREILEDDEFLFELICAITPTLQ